MRNNKLTVAVYPICVEVVEGELKKGTICFKYDNKLHDHQQGFRKPVFEVIRKLAELESFELLGLRSPDHFTPTLISKKL